MSLSNGNSIPADRRVLCWRNAPNSMVIYFCLVADQHVSVRDLRPVMQVHHPVPRNMQAIEQVSQCDRGCMQEVPDSQACSKCW